jgi:hypothetical protein
LCHEAIELKQSRVLVRVLIDVDIELLDALDRQLLMGQGQYVGIGRKTIGVVDDSRWERRREENSLDVLGQKTVQINAMSLER